MKLHKHKWIAEYYGLRCIICNTFYNYDFTTCVSIYEYAKITNLTSATPELNAINSEDKCKGKTNTKS